MRGLTAAIYPESRSEDIRAIAKSKALFKKLEGIDMYIDSIGGTI